MLSRGFLVESVRTDSRSSSSSEGRLDSLAEARDDRRFALEVWVRLEECMAPGYFFCLDSIVAFLRNFVTQPQLLPLNKEAEVCSCIQHNVGYIPFIYQLW